VFNHRDARDGLDAVPHGSRSAHADGGVPRCRTRSEAGIRRGRPAVRGRNPGEWHSADNRTRRLPIGCTGMRLLPERRRKTAYPCRSMNAASLDATLEPGELEHRIHLTLPKDKI